MLKITTLFCLLFFVSSFYSQGTNEKKTLKKARKYLSEANYNESKREYEKLISADPKNSLYYFEAGVAYYNSYYQREKSLSYFENALKASSTDTIAEIFFYLGKANQYIGNFQEAKTNYLKFKSFVVDNKEGSYVGGQLDRFVQMCDNAIALQQQYEDGNTDITIKNLGGSINTLYAEYGSVIKKDGSIILFTTRDRENVGKKYYFDSKKHEDIYVAEAVDDTSWKTRTKVDSSKNYFTGSINTKKHDAVIGFSTNEDKLYIYRNNGIWVSTLENGKYGVPVEIEEINTKGHEPSSYLTPDGKTLYFTSNQYESKGGRDIFVSKINADGTWGVPSSVGDNINTQYDEDAPFLTSDGKTLFFASNGHNTMGGYDIYKSELNENGTWGNPINMGPGINTAADDIYYTQDSLGEYAYLSSGRAYGFGDMDIYGVSLLCRNIPNTEIRGLIVSGDNYNPLKADIVAVNAKTGEKAGTFTSDPETGKYLMILPPDNTYYLTVKSYDHGFLSRDFRDTLVLPRQCEYYQMFQHVSIAPVKEDNKITAYEATFDNATFNLKAATEEKYSVSSLDDLLANTSLTAADTSYDLHGTVKHNDALVAVNTTIKLVDEKGNVIRKTLTSSEGTYDFHNLDPTKQYSVLVDEEDLKMSYYGLNPSNAENSIIAKGNIQWYTLDQSRKLVRSNPADSMEVALVSPSHKVINKTFTDLKGDWILDNLPTTQIVDNRTFPYQLQMEDEDVLYKTMLKDTDTASNDLYTIIKDLIDVPESVVIDKQIAFDPIYFDFDKFFLRLESKEILDKIKNYMSENTDMVIEIMGHTDWYGTDDYNIKLSKNRSKSAFDYLKTNGISTDRMTMKWFGESQPAVPNANPDGTDNPENRQLNRRCEFKITDGTTEMTIVLQ